MTIPTPVPKANPPDHQAPAEATATEELIRNKEKTLFSDREFVFKEFK